MENIVLGSRYELLERIGLGGMAVVYKAKDRMLNRFVAVKILREEFKENEDFKKALREYPDRQEAEQMAEGYMRLLGWMREREREGLDRKER